MADAIARFEMIMKALSPKQSTATFRQLMMTAYGFEPPVVLDNVETAKKEKKFAEKCLNGVGPNQQEIAMDADLRAVLLKEIGYIHEAPYVNRDGLRIDVVATPWLMGDWIQMAELIIHYAMLEIGDDKNDQALHSPQDIVRLWPIDTSVHDDGWNLDTRVPLKQEGTDRIECVIKGKESDKGGGSRIIALQAAGKKFKRYTWLILPEGPDKLMSSSKEKGLASNLWTGLVYSPGTPQEEK